MEAKRKKFKKNEFYQTYVAQINWDWLLSKAQLIFGIIFMAGLICFVLWFTS
ncbi:hypothetical protein RM545_13860 [Zunongwangia sp. F260]|uniref:Uncharacterized protein n=1 Tax=Autumnicola lenta TaxID=3075593 RepID=A0ABU3CN48_9FLAO|nr:hypothetical protein [Zunongwangia sp. F260]MDT0647780.1 hypothetical protein [Zunongwangia sp. F260]